MSRVNDHSLFIARLFIARELNADLPSALVCRRELRRAAQSCAGHSLSPSDGLPLVNHRLVVAQLAHATRKLSRLSPPIKGERSEALGAV
jgi:hypothetical protein